MVALFSAMMNGSEFWAPGCGGGSRDGQKHTESYGRKGGNEGGREGRKRGRAGRKEGRRDERLMHGPECIWADLQTDLVVFETKKHFRQILLYLALAYFRKKSLILIS